MIRPHRRQVVTFQDSVDFGGTIDSHDTGAILEVLNGSSATPPVAGGLYPRVRSATRFIANLLRNCRVAFLSGFGCCLSKDFAL